VLVNSDQLAQAKYINSTL